MQRSVIDVAIIGAGPYGLSLATYLRERGVEHRIFGSPMQMWHNVPRSVCLKSLGFATTIPTPQGHPTLPEYCRTRGLEDYEPIEIATFANYGMLVQERLVPYLEKTLVTDLTRWDDEFLLTLESGERVRARRVVIAIGLSYFEHIPEALAELPRELVSHTVQHSDFASFAGSDVIVVGAGASALEAATLLHEHGSQVRMVVRGDVKWGFRGPREAERSLLQRIRVPLTVLGHGRDHWVLQHFPMLMHYLPDERRLRIVSTYLGPSGPWWLHDRAEGKFPIYERTAVRQATIRNGKVCLHVYEDGVGERELLADHVIAGTGYRVDVDRVAFLNPGLAREIRRLDRAPQLSRHFESSVRGLYFIGPSSLTSFGPLVRFVAGAAFTVPRVAGHLTRPGVLGRLWRRSAAMAVKAPPVRGRSDRVRTQTEP